MLVAMPYSEPIQLNLMDLVRLGRELMAGTVGPSIRGERQNTAQKRPETVPSG